MLDPAELVEMPGNENVMDEATFKSLVRFMRERGFKQPILVRQLKSGPEERSVLGRQFAIVDGKHRKDAAIEVGLKQVPCVLDVDMTEAEAKAIRIGMNRNRGDLDLAAVGRTMLELSVAGWSPTDLTVVGFDEQEVQALLEAAAGGPDPDSITASVSVADKEPKKDQDQTHVLKINFSELEDYERAQAVLKKAGSGNLATGLIAVLDEAGL